MIIKKYVAKTMNEAMTRIKYELGKDALIMGQKKVRKKGFKGFFSSKLIEVTVAIENNVTEIKSNEDTMLENNFTKAIPNFNDKLKNNADIVQNNIQLMQQIQEVKDLLSENINNGHKKQEKIDILKKLEEQDIDSYLINLFSKELNFSNDLKKDEAIIKQKLNELIKIDTSDLNGVIALVGPTGVGKTTTIAKLAGKLSLVEKKKVGLITIDTYRIGAVEQLRTYSEIINIPFKVAISSKEMEKAIDEMSDCDVILIDTTGRSSKNFMQISEMRSLINKAKPNKIHLVISSIIKNRDIKEIIKGYSQINYDSVIITKLDETSANGSIINILYESRKPLSYLTVGQNVPDDMIKPNKEQLVRIILGEERI